MTIDSPQRIAPPPVPRKLNSVDRLEIPLTQRSGERAGGITSRRTLSTSIAAAGMIARARLSAPIRAAGTMNRPFPAGRNSSCGTGPSSRRESRRD